MAEQTKFLLDEKEMPTAWYNIQADLDRPLDPVVHPATMKPVGPEDLAPLFPMELIMQEAAVGPLATWHWPPSLPSCGRSSTGGSRAWAGRRSASSRPPR